MGVAKAGTLKLVFRAKRRQNSIFFKNTFLHVKDIPKLQKPCWPYRHFNKAIKFAATFCDVVKLFNEAFRYFTIVFKIIMFVNGI